MDGLTNSMKMDRGPHDRGNLLIFVGGAKGVGKSSILDLLRQDPGEERINILDMSDVLEDAAVKRYGKGIVELGSMSREFQQMQTEIIEGARGLDFTSTFLDGHYLHVYPDGSRILHYNFDPEFMVHFDAHVVITARPETILARRNRDSGKERKGDLRSIEMNQEGELEEAQRLAGIEGKEAFVIENTAMEQSVEQLRGFLAHLHSS